MLLSQDRSKVFPAISTSTGGPFCWRCQYHLAGLPAQGCCPECAQRYDARRGMAARSCAAQLWLWINVPRGLLLAEVWSARPWLAERIVPSFRSVAIMTLVAGNTVILAAFGAAAMRHLF